MITFTFPWLPVLLATLAFSFSVSYPLYQHQLLYWFPLSVIVAFCMFFLSFGIQSFVGGF